MKREKDVRTYSPAHPQWLLYNALRLHILHQLYGSGAIPTLKFLALDIPTELTAIVKCDFPSGIPNPHCLFHDFLCTANVCQFAESEGTTYVLPPHIHKVTITRFAFAQLFGRLFFFSLQNLGPLRGATFSTLPEYLPSHCCRDCSEKFDSKTKLHKHLEDRHKKPPSIPPSNIKPKQDALAQVLFCKLHI